jgi:hypothetical protein
MSSLKFDSSKYQSELLEPILFQDFIRMVDKLYQESLANIFDGALEIIMLKTQKIRFFNESEIQQ